MWTLMPQQQQRGAQLGGRRRGDPGKGAPPEAVAGREAQDHEQAGEAAGVPEAGYPASRLEDRQRDNTPGAPEPRVRWDDVVQPEQAPPAEDEAGDNLPLPEGK